MSSQPGAMTPEIEETRRRYEFIVNAVGDMMSVVGPDHRYEAVNDAWCRALGRARGEVIGYRVAEIWGEEAYARDIAPCLEACVRDRAPISLNATIHFPKLGARDCAVTYYPYLGLDGVVSHIVVVTRDVTERTRAEAEARKLALVAARTDNAVVITDADGVTEWVNEGFTRITGYSYDEVVGRKPGALLQGEGTDPRTVAFIAEHLRRGEGFACEIVNHAKDGRRYWLAMDVRPIRDDAGRLTNFIAIESDITARKQAEVDLRASEARLRAVLDSTVDGIVVIDAQGRVESFNSAAEAIFGYRADQVLGGNVSMLMPEPDRGAHDGYLRRYGETGDARVIGVGREVIGLRGNGERFPLDLAVSEVHLEDQRWFIGTVRDITARKRFEAELVRAREAAEQANRAKSEFLSSMSHELRTPMNAILGFAQLLELEGELNAGQADSVREIIKGGHHLLALINEVLDLSRIESGRLTLSMEPVALTELIDECAALVESGAVRQGLSMSRDLARCESRFVLADRLRLKQVLLNLLSNAVKYNRDGGLVEIECAFRESGRVRLTVRDTGIGIPPERQRELFTAFNRLGHESSEIEGTGIGLVISKRLIELMGGEIGVDSQPGEGSRFWIELPETVPGALPDAPAPARSPETGRGDTRHSVLYIEDNPANLKLVEQALKRRPDLRVIGCQDPWRGLDLAQSQRPDLILLDINLPGIDGYEVLRRLHANPTCGAIPVVAISANAMTADVARGLAAGFHAYLSKPLDIADLLRAVDAGLRPRGDGETGA